MSLRLFGEIVAPSSFPTSRFQFERTKPLRAWVYREARLSLRRRILEVGSGEGPVAEEIAARTARPVVALDLRPGGPRPGVVPLRGDAHRLPLSRGTAGAVAYHFALLWLRNPEAALREAHRVLGPGGAVLILSEPDLTRRVEEPDVGLGRLLAEVVRRSGGQPAAGVGVHRWLREAGFRPHLREAPLLPQMMEDPAELLHECNFVASCGMDASSVRRKVTEIYGGGGTVRVTLPLAYGWAARESEGR